MRKIINGKRYDTETAQVVAKWCNGLSTTDFHRVDETLYRTKRGNWFIHGEGGAASRYSEPCGDMNGPGENIVPLTPEEALKWMENHGLVDEAERFFNKEIEDA